MAYNPRIIPMQKWNGFPRVVLLLILLIGMAGGFFVPEVVLGDVNAAPLQAADELNIVISEFRFRGPGGVDDEFVEIYNATGGTFTLINWSLKKSSECGDYTTDLVSSINISLAPGQYYLFAKSGTYSGVASADTTYSTAGVADDGGIALLDGSNIIDQVGLCSTTAYKEGTSLASLTNSVNQSYERKAGGNAGNCKDTDNNSVDFILNSSSSNPQNSSSSLLPCIVVTNVSSTNGTYSANQNVDITVAFSNNVNVTGTPTLLLETGTTDRNATYLSGSGSSSLIFRYTVVAGDTSNDLDYVSANALSLNGGSITGAIGDATLILPKPGQANSLGVNNAIVIDNGVAPSVLSFQRQSPSSSSTNADSLIFRVTFSEAVTGVDTGDFDVQGTTTGTAPSLVSPVSGSIYDVTLSGGDLPVFNGVVGLNLSATPSISDLASTPLPATEPSTDETYTVDNVNPSVTVNQAVGQADPATSQPVNFTVVFSEPINTSTFTSSDIDDTGSTAFNITWTISNSGDNKTFTISAIASDNNGTIIPTIPAGSVTDLAGNSSLDSTFTDNFVLLDDNTSPSVTVNQASSQLDPAGVFPINFTIVFSEPINPSVFTTSDITQNGTATGVTWSITNSGDNETFTLAATAASGYGTIIPSIAANRVTDWAGNNNTASTSTDNTVTYALISNAVRSVIINEVAWAGTTSGLTDDEWIELYNPGSSTMNISGWRLKATDGDPDILIPNGKTIPAGGFYLLERDNDNTVSDITADQIYSGALSNSGEILTLYDPTNKVIDTANGNGGSWPAGSSATYGTMERRSGTTDSDSAWATNTGVKKNGKNADGGDILGTPKSSNTPAASVTPVKTSTPFPTSTPIPAAVVIDPRPIINEILPRPGFDWNQDGRVDVFDEFIEIKNLTAIDINLSGWVLDDEEDTGSEPYTIPSVILKPGQRVVFYGLETNILLSDGGDTVRLIHPTNGKIYDAYTYSIAKYEDLSICRLPDGNVFGGWYDDCIPTPNLTNTREGVAPSMPGGGYESPVCELPDTIPEEFLLAECNGYGANIWNAFYWDESGWLGTRIIPQNLSKWETFIK